MAGSLVAVASEQAEKTVTAIGDQWEVQYSRFFNTPSLSSTFPSLILRDTRRDRSRGTWLSSSSTALLKLTADHSNSEVILAVVFLDKIHEEHQISKLHFTWPHVSCMSGFPARGSRAVFASYRDSAGQIQKFALRFSSIYETEAFMNGLKEIVEGVRDTGLPCANFVSGISSQSEFIPSDEPSYRPKEDWSSMASLDMCANQMQSSLNNEVTKSSNSQDDLKNDFESICAALPPSFSSLVMSCRPVAEQAAAQATVSGDNDLRSHIKRYMEDSSFQDLLVVVEKVMSEFGDDVLL